MGPGEAITPRRSCPGGESYSSPGRGKPPAHCKINTLAQNTICSGAVVPPPWAAGLGTYRGSPGFRPSDWSYRGRRCTSAQRAFCSTGCTSDVNHYTFGDFLAGDQFERTAFSWGSHSGNLEVDALREGCPFRSSTSRSAERADAGPGPGW